jgi:pimeloyl-ACP methyl ester carboxylesterase
MCGETPDNAQGRRAALSRWIDIDGPYHYLDFGGESAGPTFVCLHGLSGSSGNWASIAPSLTETGRVLAVDLVGFGRSERRGRPVTLAANQAYFDRFLSQVTDGPVVLIGHSMGATIATLHAARRPETVAGLVLINPAIPWQFQDKASPWVAIALGILALAGRAFPSSARNRYARDASSVFFDFLRVRYAGLPSGALKLAARKADAAVRLGGRTKDAQTRMALKSLVGMLARRWRFAALARRVQAPVLLLHGDRDRLVPSGAISAIAAANPGWCLRIARGAGHFPPLEVPGWTVDRILAWLRKDELDEVSADILSLNTPNL